MDISPDIWIFNPFDNLPEEGVRPQRYAMLSKALVRAGFNVIWWSGNFRHATKTFRGTPPVYTNGDGVQMRLLPTEPYRKNISLRRIRSHRKLAASWLKQALADVECGRLAKPRAIITSLPPLSSGRVAHIMQKRWGCAWIVDIQDAWPEAFYQALPKFCKRLRLLHPLEKTARKTLRQADAVIAVGETYRRWAEKCGAEGVLLARIGIELDREDKSLPSRKWSVPKLLYLGNMGKSYDLQTVVESCKTNGWELNLAGTGDREEELARYAAGISGIKFHGFLDCHAVARIAAECNIAVIPMFDSSQVSIPNKISDYALFGLPIVNSLSGETRSLIEKYDAGAFYRAGDQASFAEAVKSIRPEQAENSATMGREEFDAAKIYPGIAAFIDALPAIAPEKPPRRRRLKRLFDLAFAVFTAPLWLPLLLVVAMLSLVIQGRPVFFLQERPGRQCRIFKIIKFRTMRQGDGDDRERMTGWGSFLRRTSLDELPEMINVIAGEMSLVGPRPLLVRYLDRYSEEQLRRQDVPPGITGWAQVNGRNAISWPEKLALDIWYVDNQSFMLDLRILLKTVASVLLRKGISHASEATMPEFTGEE